MSAEQRCLFSLLVIQIIVREAWMSPTPHSDPSLYQVFGTCPQTVPVVKRGLAWLASTSSKHSQDR